MVDVSSHPNKHNQAPKGSPTAAAGQRTFPCQHVPLPSRWSYDSYITVRHASLPPTLFKMKRNLVIEYEGQKFL